MYHPRLEWEGIKLNGKRFASVEVANLCRDFGQAHVLEACIDLDVLPTPDSINQIRQKCQQWEDKLL